MKDNVVDMKNQSKKDQPIIKHISEMKASDLSDQDVQRLVYENNTLRQMLVDKEIQIFEQKNQINRMRDELRNLQKIG